jgi:hypothetical protein
MSTESEILSIPRERASALRSGHLGELLYNPEKQNRFALEDGNALYDCLFSRLCSVFEKTGEAYLNIYLETNDGVFPCQVLIRGEFPRNTPLPAGTAIELDSYSAGNGPLESILLRRGENRTRIQKIRGIPMGAHGLGDETLDILFGLLYSS